MSTQLYQQRSSIINQARLQLQATNRYRAWSILLLSAVVSCESYAWLLHSWWISAGFVFLIICHELGHYCVARWYGYSPSLPVLIPFLGAVIFLDDGKIPYVRSAVIAAAGPIIGSVATIPFLLVAQVTQNTDCFFIAILGFVTNIFNLIPLYPLDGGRIVAAISPYIWGLGAMIAAFFTILLNPWVLIVLGVVTIVNIYLHTQSPVWAMSWARGGLQSCRPPIFQRIVIAILYASLVAILIGGCYWYCFIL